MRKAVTVLLCLSIVFLTLSKAQNNRDSLSQAANWLKRNLSKVAVDRLTGKPIIGAVGVEGCTMSYTRISPYTGKPEEEVKLPLGGLRWVGQPLLLQGNVPGAGLTTVSIRSISEKGISRVRTDGTASYTDEVILNFKYFEMARTVANALRHAAELCREK